MMYWHFNADVKVVYRGGSGGTPEEIKFKRELKEEEETHGAMKVHSEEDGGSVEFGRLSKTFIILDSK